MNHESSLIIDIRERHVIEYCQEQKIDFQSSSLEVGDIIITHGEHSLVFERKTIADVAASIKDGRFSEQKNRLKTIYPFHRITYLIEGSTDSLRTSETLYNISTQALVSSFISSRYRDGFQVIHTKDIADTVWHVQEIRKRMGEKTTLDTETKEFISTIKVKSKKMDNITPEVCYIMQLSQLPGFSVTIAQEIATVYPSMSLLLKAITEKGEKAFKEIKGLGKKRIQLIVTYIK